MGFMNFIKGQFIDIVEWPEENPNILVHRFERYGNEIKNNAKLVVRPGQKAIFVNEGQIADQFEPGTYVLSTKNMPILTTLLSLPTGFQSWHKAEVYFIKTTEQLNRKWGTPEGILMRDPDFVRVRIRAFGNYAYKIGQSNDMISRFVGARSEYTAEEFEAQITPMVVTDLTDALGELKIPVLDIAASYKEIGAQVKTNLNESVAPLGLEITVFTVTNVNLPEDVQKGIDEMGNVQAKGGIGMYTQKQMADSMRDMANNQGGGANIMGMMFGGGMGNMMNQQMMNQQMMMNQQQMMQQQQMPQQQMPQQQMQPPPPPAAPTYYIAVNGQRQGPFGMNELQNMAMAGTFTTATLVWTNGMANWQAASTVQALAALFGAVPPPPPPPPPMP